MDTQKLIASVQQFRNSLYNTFCNRQDTLMDLVDALCSNQTARSAVELSLNPLFKREYSALYKAIAQFLRKDSTQLRTQSYKQWYESILLNLSELIPQPQTRDFYLFGVDVTPYPRPFAPTLKDRTYIHQPNTIKGNKPINIGHAYSILTLLPERIDSDDTPWAIPLLGQRVDSSSNGVKVGSEQLNAVQNLEQLPWFNQLCVAVADSQYSQRNFLAQQVKLDNLVTITRVRSNRVFYSQPVSDTQQNHRRGHPQWYGQRFALNDETTWHEPNQIFETGFSTRSGRKCHLTIKAWSQMLVRGSKDCPLHLHPFTLLQITITDELNKQLWKPMWLMVIGQRRDELTPNHCYEAYRQRYDLEHMLRFTKQRLLMQSFQTPELEHEENWVQLTLTAYVQLWVARKLALHLPRPWEYYLARSAHTPITPSLVQRDFTRIISQIGSPALSPKQRGYSSGRANGHYQATRPRHQIIKKGRKRRTSTSTAA